MSMTDDRTFYGAKVVILTGDTTVKAPNNTKLSIVGTVEVNGAPVGGFGLNGCTGLWKGTQAQYDAIGTKDPNVVYVVI